MERTRKKQRKMRGRRETGFGSTKGHRAAGQRGGKGNAGSDKHHKMKYLKADPRYFGKWGFKPLQEKDETVDVINVGTLDSWVSQLAERGIAVKNGDKYSLDVSALGIDKILGSGTVSHALDLTGVKSVSASAREKIVASGGSVDAPESDE